MDSYKTILTGISLSPLDEKVVPYASLLYAIYQPERLIFLHVFDADHASSTINEVEAAVKKRVATLYERVPPENMHILVVSGKPEEVLIEKSKDKSIDLLILGRKTSEKNETLTSTLVNTAGCSLCLVPDHAVIKISNVVVAVDFSEQSHHGLDTALAIANNTGAQIHCLNVYTVPSGYHTTGKDYEEFADIMKNNAIEASDKFKKKWGYTGALNFEFILDDDTDPADKLYDFSKRMNADLVCIGSKGMSSFAAIFFDSTAEKLVEFSNNIPLLIVKGKNQNRSLLDIIREL